MCELCDERNQRAELEELLEDQIDIVQTDIHYGLTIGARRDAQNMATTAFELHPELRDHETQMPNL